MPYKVKRKKKVKAIRPSSSVDYSTGPAYSSTSLSREATNRMYDRSGANESGLSSKLVMNPDGTFTRKSIDSSPAY